MTAERYWEARWRDEAADNEKLTVQLQRAVAKNERLVAALRNAIGFLEANRLPTEEAFVRAEMLAAVSAEVDKDNST